MLCYCDNVASAIRIQTWGQMGGAGSIDKTADLTISKQETRNITKRNL
jgi:hypothetical protein